MMTIGHFISKYLYKRQPTNPISKSPQLLLVHYAITIKVRFISPFFLPLNVKNAVRYLTTHILHVSADPLKMEASDINHTYF